MAVQRLGHVAVRVEDMARAKAFYEALGLRVTWDADDWAYLQSPESGDGIALLAPSYRQAGPHFAFHFEDRARVDRVVDWMQRADVDEELDRLDGHLVEIRRVMTGSEAAGRRLDFLMQELNREANTLSSKSQELDTTRIAVDMKVLIEQMREQIQNIE